MKPLSHISALILVIITPFIKAKPVDRLAHAAADELPASTEQPTDHLSLVTGKLISIYLTAAELLLIIYK